MTILAFGWFGFNPGSTLAGTDLRISFIVVNTMLASFTGATFAMFTLMAKGLKPDTTMMCNGMLAGLVAITAPCAFVNSISACVIGLIAGILVVEGCLFIERQLKVEAAGLEQLAQRLQARHDHVPLPAGDLGPVLATPGRELDLREPRPHARLPDQGSARHGRDSSRRC